MAERLDYTVRFSLLAALVLVAAVPPPGRGPFLGILTEEIPEVEVLARGGRGGARVLSLVDGSPASGKLDTGDVVLAIDEQPVAGPRDFLERAAALPVGATAQLLVERAGVARAVEVVTAADAYLSDLGEADALAVVGQTYVHINFPRPASRAGSGRPLPPPARGEQGFLGVSIQDNPDAARFEDEGMPRGALVRSVLPGSAAAVSGVQPGDVITWVGGRPVETAGELMAEVASRSPGSTVDLVLQRQDQQLNVTAMLRPKK